MEVGGNLALPCVGTFVASEEANNPLKISEPPSHDKWDPQSARLNNLPAEERELVQVVINRLKANLRKFSSEAAPPAPKQELRIKFLERLLGDVFKPPSKGQGGSGHPADPIEIHFLEQPYAVVEAGSLTTRGTFRLSISDEATRDEIYVCLTVECNVGEDDGFSSEDPIDVKLQSLDVDFQTDKSHQAACS